MKKIICFFLSFILMFLSISAFAAGKLSTTKENFWVINGWTTYAYAYARIENIGNKPINVNAGVLEVYDADGNVITSTDYMSTYAKTLQPNEYTYIKLSKDINIAEDVGKPDDYMLTITGKTDDSSWTKRLPVETKLSLNETNGWWTYDYMYVTITNNTDETIYNISTVVVLLDDNNNILYLDDDTMYSYGLLPGNSVVLKKQISSTFMDYFKAHNITPTKVDAIAYIDN